MHLSSPLGADRRGRRDLGASTAEYAGLIVLAALILGAVVPLVNDTVSQKVSSAVCQILHIGGPCQAGPATEAGTAAQRQRNYSWKGSECTRSSKDESYGLRVDVNFVSVAGGVKFMKTVTADGQVQLTALNTGTANLIYTDGGKLKLKRGPKGDVSGEVGGGVNGAIGDTWKFPNEAAAKQFESKIKRLATVDSAKQVPGLSTLAKGYEKYFPTHLPPPNITRKEIGLKGYATGSLDTPKAGSNPQLIPPILLNAGVNVESKAIIEYDKAAGTNSVTYSFTQGGSVNIGGKQRPLTDAGTMKITRDAHGNIVDLQLTGDHATGSTADVKKFDLKAENASDRATIESYLNSSGGSVGNGGGLKMIFGGGGQTEINQRTPYIRLNRSVNPVYTKFDQLLYDKGRFLHQTFSDSQYNQIGGLGGEINDIGVGVYLPASGDSRSLRSSEYLAAPGADGVRRYKKLPACSLAPGR